MLRYFRRLLGIKKDEDYDDEDDAPPAKTVKRQHPAPPRPISRPKPAAPTSSSKRRASEAHRIVDNLEDEEEKHSVRSAVARSHVEPPRASGNQEVIVVPKRTEHDLNPLRPIEPTIEERESIQKYNGEVITAEKYPLTDAAKRHCALLDNGWFLIDKSESNNARVIGVMEDLRKNNLKITRVLRVPMSDIKTTYARHNRAFGSGRVARNVTEIRGIEAQQFQKEFLHLIEKAAKDSVSDIHVFVRQNHCEIKMRVNGEMEVIEEKASEWGHQLCQAAYAMSAASDSTYLRGEFQGSQVNSSDVPLATGVGSIRIQQNPLPMGGRYMICRLLLEGGRGEDVDFATLGYQRVHIQSINAMRRASEGVIVIAGPTGSGKSTTLVIALRNDQKENPGKNIITVEDPPEFTIDGAAQLAVTNANTVAEKKIKFELALNAALRSDPDIIMIGEIRDAASAGLAFKAAQTGHRVYASLHASNAIAILGRLREIGVEMYNLTEPALMSGMIGQRLVRKLCPHCRIPLDKATPEQLKMETLDKELINKCREIYACSETFRDKHNQELSGIFITNHNGCSKCRKGISGRAVVSETIAPEMDFMIPIREGKTLEAQKVWMDAHSGLTMPEHALQRMVTGISSPRDVISMTGDIMKFDENARGHRVFGDLMQ